MISKRTKISLVLFFVAGFTCAALWLVRSPTAHGITRSASQDDGQMVEPRAKLGRKAKATRGADPIAVRDLTDEAFNAFALPEVPVFTQEGMKERLVRAELNYRKGADKGISEVQVARTVNELANKLQIPDYAKVSPAMVRLARVGLMLELPHFIAQDAPAGKKRKKIGSSINPFMSPLEATSVTLFLLQQKMLNDAFQVPHKEFFANVHEKQLQKWGEWRAKKDGGAQPISDGQAQRQSDHKMRVVSNSKTDNARRAARRAAEAMSPDALLNLADSSLDTLGIKR